MSIAIGSSLPFRGGVELSFQLSQMPTQAYAFVGSSPSSPTILNLNEKVSKGAAVCAPCHVTSAAKPDTVL
jgi:hypothetical protein